MTRVIAHLTDKQKPNGRTNRHKEIKSYNTLAFIPIMGQIPIKRHKQP